MKIDKLIKALSEISDMCVGEIAMNYKLDPNLVGEIIYKATGLTAPQLDGYVKTQLVYQGSVESELKELREQMAVATKCGARGRVMSQRIEGDIQRIINSGWLNLSEYSHSVEANNRGNTQ